MIMLFNLLVTSVVYTFALMIDLMLVLLCVRIFIRLWPLAILVEFDQAGRPLIDRTLSVASHIWQRFSHSRILCAKRTLLVTAGGLFFVRLVLAGMLGLLAD